MKADYHMALRYARNWVRRSPGPDAWANLAAVYATKTPADLRQARRWYWRAARRGHMRALFEYGLILIHGEGGRKNVEQGRHYLERAAVMGQRDAQKILGRQSFRAASDYKNRAGDPASRHHRGG